MQKTYKKTVRPVAAAICSLMGHDYIITNKITDHLNEYECASCRKEVCDNTKGYLEELTLRQKEINKSISTFFQKRNRRQLTA